SGARREVVMSRRSSLQVAAGALLLGAALRFAGDARGADAAQKYLYVWAGDQAHKAADFLAVVDFDEGSRDYGKLVKSVPLPPPGETSNEPHHVGLSSDGKTLACGG